MGDYQMNRYAPDTVTVCQTVMFIMFSVCHVFKEIWGLGRGEVHSWSRWCVWEKRVFVACEIPTKYSVEVQVIDSFPYVEQRQYCNPVLPLLFVCRL